MTAVRMNAFVVCLIVTCCDYIIICSSCKMISSIGYLYICIYYNTCICVYVHTCVCIYVGIGVIQGDVTAFVWSTQLHWGVDRTEGIHQQYPWESHWESGKCNVIVFNGVKIDNSILAPLKF